MREDKRKDKKGVTRRPPLVLSCVA